MTEPLSSAEIGILGGSGFYEFLTDAEELRVDTPFGEPSDAVVVGTFGGRQVAFLPRHGRGHRTPPHRINYRANLWALKELGISRLLAPCAVGSLRADLPPGTFVVLDQLVDRTWGRPDTYFDGPGSAGGDERVTHVSLAEPYCSQLRDVAAASLAELGIAHELTGALVVIQGPRFATKAESRWFGRNGGDVIGMTQCPEIPLARELELCPLGIALVTDYDAGLEDEPDIEAVTSAAVLEVFQQNVGNLRRLLEHLVPALPVKRTCRCGHTLEGAQL
ncbi:MAG: S-methyl-5'-thioadenosine phosphorylase [Nitriliruptorales bacterium]